MEDLSFIKSCEELCKELKEAQYKKLVGLINEEEIKDFKALFNEIYTNYLSRAIFAPKDVRKVSDDHYDSQYTGVIYTNSTLNVQRFERVSEPYHGYGVYIEYLVPIDGISGILNNLNRVAQGWESQDFVLDIDTKIITMKIFIAYEFFPLVAQKKARMKAAVEELVHKKRSEQ